MSPRVQFFPWNFNAIKDFCIWNLPFSTHLYIIQAACGSLGTSLDIKFSLNSPRIEQLHVSNYHRFVITRGLWGAMEEEHGDERQCCKRAQGLRGTGMGSEAWGLPLWRSELGEVRIEDKATKTPEARGTLSHFLVRLFLSPWTISSSWPLNICLTSTSQQGKAEKGRGRRGCLCFAAKTQEMMRKSTEALFEDRSPLRAVREVENGSGRVCWLPLHPWIPRNICTHDLVRTDPGWRWRSWLGPSEKR